MKIGKVSESILKRSVFKQIKTKREEVMIGAGIGEDCAILLFQEDEGLLVTTDPITVDTKEIGQLGVINVVNDIAAAGGTPIGVLVTLLMPLRTREIQIESVMEQVEAVCKDQRIQIIGGHTEITDGVNRPMLSMTGIGKLSKSFLQKPRKARPGQDVVISKWIGLEGTCILAKEQEKLLQEKYPVYFIEEAKRFDRYLSIVPEAATAIRFGVSVMHDVTEGGIFGALWEMAEKANVGLEMNLKKLPIRQETIEICEMLHLNPYELLSGGALIMIADNGYDLVSLLQREGIEATVAGKITEGNDRIIINEDEVRYLEPPKSDEVYKPFGQENLE